VGLSTLNFAGLGEELCEGTASLRQCIVYFV